MRGGMYSKYMLPFYADRSLFKKEKYLEVALFLVIDDFTDGKFLLNFPYKRRNVYFILGTWGEVRAFLTFICSQLTLAQNNSHDKLAYLGVACCELQLDMY